MKRLNILILAIAFIGFGRAFGQNLLITPGDTFTYNGTLATASDVHEQNGFFINNTANADSIYWRVTSATMDTVWQMSFCDPENCYYFTSTAGSFTPKRFWATPGTSYLLRFGVSPNCSADSGKLTVVAWLANDSANSAKTLYYNAAYTGSCSTGVGIQTVPTSNVRVYPTPVNNSMTVDGLGGFTNVKLSVYDVLGNAIIQKYLAQPFNLTNVNTEMLHAGIYFVTIDSDGTRILTKRIEKLD